MDRRDALKKLGMGGATVVGASMVMSSQAFANPGTNDCAALAGTPTVTATQNSGNGDPPSENAQVTVTYTGLGTISCPCNPGSTALNAGPDTWTLSNAATAPAGTSAIWTDLANGTYTYSFRLRISCLDGPAPAGLAVCSIYTVTGTFTVNGNQNGFVLVSPNATGEYDPAPCP